MNQVPHNCSNFRILVAECEQEISTFNPKLSDYDLFDIKFGYELLAAHKEAQTSVRGALNVLLSRQDIEIIPLYGATACSAGPLTRAGFERIASELLGQVQRYSENADALYFSLHGSMGTESEPDPEGYLLEQARNILGPDIPIVISLDLHGILTERMLLNCNAVTVYHTYPHEDFVDTGERAAKLLLRILENEVNPVMARVSIPAMVRGTELNTKTGSYGEVIRTAKQFESNDLALAAAVLIGNPFNDVHEFGVQSLVVTDKDEISAKNLALELAKKFWEHHKKMTATLTNLEEAIDEAMKATGPIAFTDASDAPSSGASGDSNTILKKLLKKRYPFRAIIPIVDEPAVKIAHNAGVGANVNLLIGGTIDPERFPPIKIKAEVEILSNGRYIHQYSRMQADAGLSAVLRCNNIKLVLISRSVFMMDRSIFLAHGQNPKDFDLIVIKSPGAYSRYFKFAKNYVVDTPGATSPNLKRLGHIKSPRPIFPLDENIIFNPVPEYFDNVSSIK